MRTLPLSSEPDGTVPGSKLIKVIKLLRATPGGRPTA
jgi:hypothetical protein